MRFYFVIWTVSALLLLPKKAAAQSCGSGCQAPTNESTASAGIDPRSNDMTLEMFVMTLSGGQQWSGGTITESEGGASSDSCYTNSNGKSPYRPVTVNGSSWTIGTSFQGAGIVAVGATQWGADEIGYYQNAVAWYRINLPGMGKRLPCGLKAYQNLTFTCPSASSGEDIFYNVPLSATIYATSVYDCRDGNCVTVNH